MYLCILMYITCMYFIYINILNTHIYTYYKTPYNLVLFFFLTVCLYSLSFIPFLWYFIIIVVYCTSWLNLNEKIALRAMYVRTYCIMCALNIATRIMKKYLSKKRAKKKNWKGHARNEKQKKTEELRCVVIGKRRKGFT